ncbi:MAG: FecR family protein [Treponema sp.]|jgi:hypothetical protein|nr:FecR family protein [Treponema sp.]
MPKSRSTKSRRISAADAAVICASLLGTAAFLGLFQNDLNRSLRLIDQEPVGIVASRFRAALRRFQDRIIWDRLQKDSPVYNGDFIRTAEGSEAAVSFPGGAMAAIAENSLIRIFMEAEGLRIDYSGGNISVYAGETGSLTVSAGGNRVRAAAGAALSLDAGEDGAVSLQVLEGSVALGGPGGEREAPAGTALSIGGDSENGTFEELPAALGPPPAARFLSIADSPAQVEFTLPGSGEGRIEIAGDRDFTRPLRVWEGELPESGGRASVSAEIPPGRWWWRVSPAAAGTGETAVSGPFTVVSVPEPRPVSPAEDAVYYYRSDPPELRFQWEASAEVLYYILEAADNPGMDNPALKTEVRYDSLLYSGLAEGRWYWRVSPVFSALYRGSAPASPLVSFTVVRGDPPPPAVAEEAPVETAPPETAVEEPPPAVPVEAPRPAISVPPSPPPPPPPAALPQPAAIPPLPAPSGRRPETGYVLDLVALSESRTLVFSWNPVDGADAYAFTLFRETGPGRREPVVNSEGPQTSYTLEDLSLLDTGRFVWQVEALNRETGERRGRPGENVFTVDIPQPAVPRGQNPGDLYGR